MAAVLMKACFLLFTTSAVQATISGNCAPGDQECHSDQAVLLQHRPVVDTLPDIPNGAILLEKISIVIDPNTTCEDKDPLCADWAAADECDTNAGWMWPNCPVSCDKCPHGDDCDQCKDLDPNCVSWAASDPSQCDTNAAWMWPNCPVSCNKCPHGDGADKCQDLHPNCAEWADADQCDSNPGWMWANCPVSCDKCPHGSVTPLPTTPAPTHGWIAAQDDKCDHPTNTGCPGGWYCRPGGYCVETLYAKGEKGSLTCPNHYEYMSHQVECYWYSVLGSGPPTYYAKELGSGNQDRMPGCWLSANGDCGNWNPKMDHGNKIDGSYLVCRLEKCTSNDMCPKSRPNCITEDNSVNGVTVGTCKDMIVCDKACASWAADKGWDYACAGGPHDKGYLCAFCDQCKS